MAAKRPFDGYPTSVGSTMLSIFPHLGPASYTQLSVTPGTIPATGGDTVTAQAEAGLKYLDKLEGGVSDDGAWMVRPIPITISNPVSGRPGLPSKTYKLQWIALVTATIGGQNQTAGSEAVAATNLSAVCVRLLGYGPK